jgi:hypothetical protein
MVMNIESGLLWESSVEFVVVNVKALSKHSTARNEENQGQFLAVSGIRHTRNCRNKGLGGITIR